MQYQSFEVPYMFFFYIPGINLSPSLEFVSPEKMNNQFYKTQHIEYQQNHRENLQQNLQKQQKQRVAQQANDKKHTNLQRKKNQKKKTSDYNPRERKTKIKNKIVYEKDKQRNILPNALSKLFFFLKSMTKSQSLIKKLLIKNQSLNVHVTVFKYYTYMNIIKSKLSRSLNEQSIEILFTLNDPQFTIFTLVEQLCFIKIIAIMSRVFLKNYVYLQLVNNSSQMPKDKISSYLKKYRIIEIKIQDCILKSKQRFNFNLLKQTLQS